MRAGSGWPSRIRTARRRIRPEDVDPSSRDVGPTGAAEDRRAREMHGGLELRSVPTSWSSVTPRGWSASSVDTSITRSGRRASRPGSGSRTGSNSLMVVSLSASSAVAGRRGPSGQAQHPHLVVLRVSTGRPPGYHLAHDGIRHDGAVREMPDRTGQAGRGREDADGHDVFQSDVARVDETRTRCKSDTDHAARRLRKTHGQGRHRLVARRLDDRVEAIGRRVGKIGQLPRVVRSE